MTELGQNITTYFGVMREDSLQAISSRFYLEKLKKGDNFMKTRKPCNKLSFIKSGLLRIYNQTEVKEVTPARYCMELHLPIVIRIHNQILIN